MTTLTRGFSFSFTKTSRQRVARLSKRLKNSALATWLAQQGHWGLRLPLSIVLLDYGIRKFPDVWVDPSAAGVPGFLFVLTAFGEVFAGLALLLGGVIESSNTQIKVWNKFEILLTRSAGAVATIIFASVIFWFFWPPTASTLHILGLGMGLFLMMRSKKTQR